MRSLLPATLLLVASITIPAQAASPQPDRPGLAHSAHLVSGGTVELETGGLWSRGFASPARVKYSFDGVFEPRIAFDMAGGQPDLGRDLAAEAKVQLMAEQTWALALFGASAVPLDEGQPWWGTARLLFALQGDRGIGARLEAGADLAGGSQGIHVAAVPLVAQVNAPITRAWTTFAEAGTWLDADMGADDFIFDGGLRWTVTDIATLDGGVGYDLRTDSGFAQVGLTVNLGRVGG